MNIYFARSLRGDRTDGDKKLYKDILAIIKSCGHRSQFEMRVATKREGLTDEQYIYQRDLEWIFNSDAMIAEVTNVSHGVGYEIAYATYVCRIPIFCACKVNTLVSAMIAGNLKVFHYKDTDELSDHIKAFLKTVAASHNTYYFEDMTR